MTQDRINRMQMSSLILLALLGPLIRFLPRRIVDTAGGMSWLSVVLAAAPAVALLALLGFAMKNRRENEGLCELLLRSLGKTAGRVFLFLIACWFLFYAGFLLRTAAERYISTAYRESHLWPFLLLLLAISLPAVFGSLPPLARCAVIFSPILIGMLLLVFCLLLPDVQWNALRPHLSGLSGTVQAIPAVINVLGVTLCFAFLGNHVSPAPGFFRHYLRLLLLLLGLSVLFCVAVLGVFGVGLTREISTAFFILLRDLSLFHFSERMEVLVIGLWVVSDFIILSALQLAAHRCLHLALLNRPPAPPRRGPRKKPVYSLRQGRWLLCLGMAAVAIAAVCIAPDSQSFRPWSDRYIPLLGTVIHLLLLPAALCIGKLRRKI